jgi:hypothetical protein
MTIQLKDIQDEVFALHLSNTELEEQVMELIEKAFALGLEEGYDEAQLLYDLKLTAIYTKLVNKPVNKND